MIPLDFSRGIFGLVDYTGVMTKQKKKRTKRYSGEDAADNQSSQPVIHRVKAADRGRVGQWWFEKKKVVKVTSITSAVIVFITWLIVELVKLLN